MFGVHPLALRVETVLAPNSPELIDVLEVGKQDFVLLLEEDL